MQETAVAGLRPVAANERIQALDMIRGFALLGILLMNIEWFSRPIQQLGTGLPAGLSGLDHAAGWFVYVFVQGKFWILFSLLFGMGFAVMSERAAAAGRGFAAPYLRRSVVLLLFGVAHALLLWVGDILHSYALAALLMLLFFRRTSTSRLWKWGLGLYAALLLLMLAGVLGKMQMSPELHAEMDRQLEAARQASQQAAAVYASGDYLAVTAQRVRDFRQVLAFNVAVVPSALSLFLLGAWLVRSGRIRDLAGHRDFYRRLVLVMLPVGLLLTAASVSLGVSFEPGREPVRHGLAGALMFAGGLPLSLGYLGLFVLGLLQPAAVRVLAWLAPAGRMALTNYLVQSLVGSLLFYGYGLALWGQVGRAAQVALVLVVFIAQVLLSRRWLSKFRYGPIEWLWRWATYGRRPAMRIASADGAENDILQGSPYR